MPEPSDDSRSKSLLFGREVLRDEMRGFVVPPAAEAARKNLMALNALFTQAGKKPPSEDSLRPGFFADVFQAILGYRMPNTAPEDFTLYPEFAVPDGGRADAVIGRSPRDPKGVLVAVELKGPRDPLIHQHGGRGESAVNQGFGYAIELRCDWILVSSMAITRLYHKGSGKTVYEQFDLATLATNTEEFRRFVFILGADRVVGPNNTCHLFNLLELSRAEGARVTKDFYTVYSDIREEVFGTLCAANRAVDRTTVLAATQKLLDRMIFCAFAEDRSLLPHDTVKNALTYRDRYNPRPKWENFKGLFRAIDLGDEELGIFRYNGGLFAPDPVLDGLNASDAVCARVATFAEYSFRAPHEEWSVTDRARAETVIDVEVLGHIFEQSITDLERMRLEIEGKVEPAPRDAKAKRKKEGAFYTPDFITGYIVENTLGPVIEERRNDLRARLMEKAKGAAREALANPGVYDVETLKSAARQALVGYWTAWQAELRRIRILDPACGSGAFLIEVFDQLLPVYDEATQHLKALGKTAGFLDLSREILQQNLYGVDLNEQAVEICRLSLWIKTAERGKILTDLNHTIRAGNSIIDDPKGHPLAFNWQAAFPEVFAEGGFDVVVGNPPYVRQEWLAPYKDWFARYKSFSGTADLYIYFLERGITLLKDGGRLGFITSGTFARSASAEEFRKWLPTVAKFESVVNLGETMPFGGDTWVFQPTMSIFRKQPGPHQFPFLFIHSDLPESISGDVARDGLMCDESVFEAKEWKFQPKEITRLFNKVMAVGKPLSEVAQGRMYRGVLTGLNEAFIVDTPTRDALVKKDARSAELLRPTLKGEDLRPWYQDWEGRWLVFTRRGVNIAEYPAIEEHLARFRESLEPRPETWKGPTDTWPGRKAGSYKWYEIQDSIDYHSEFDVPKLFWPDMCKFPRASWDETKAVVANTGYIMVPPSKSVLSVMQSHLFWAMSHQICTPLRLRAGLWELRAFPQFLTRLPIPTLATADDKTLSGIAEKITALARERHGLHTKSRHRLDDLNTQGGKLNNALYAWWDLDFKGLSAAVEKAFGTNIPVRERDDWEDTFKAWRGDHDRLTAAIIALEEELNDRVYGLFGLSKSDVVLLEDFMKRTKIFYPLGEV